MENIRQIDQSLLSLILSKRTESLDLASLTDGEWEQIAHLAHKEGVSPLLYWRLSRSAQIHLLPESLRQALRAMYYSVRMNNEAILGELEMLTDFLTQGELPVVVLKGACFALTIYPDPGLRPMADLDLLVPASKVSAARRIARSANYFEAMPEAAAGLDDLLNHAVCLKKATPPFTTLELHTTLVAGGSYRHAVPVDWFWSQIEPFRGLFSRPRLQSLLMLTPTAQVLYACAHAMLQHGSRNTSLRWLYDLDRLICVHAERLDWDMLVSQAGSFGWGSAVSAALSQVVLYFDSPVPKTLLDDLSKLSDPNAERVAAMQRPPATHTLEEYEKIKSLNLRGRIRLALALATPSPTYMRWRYGLQSSWTLPAWYVYRWWGICKDGVRTLWLLRRTTKTNS